METSPNLRESESPKQVNSQFKSRLSNDDNNKIVTPTNQNNILVSLAITQQQMEITFTAEQSTDIYEEMILPVDKLVEPTITNEVNTMDIDVNSGSCSKMTNVAEGPEPSMAKIRGFEEYTYVEPKTEIESDTLKMVDDPLESDVRNSPMPNDIDRLEDTRLHTTSSNDREMSIQDTSSTNNGRTDNDCESVVSLIGSGIPLKKSIESRSGKMKSWDEWINCNDDSDVAGHSERSNDSDVDHCNIIDMKSIHLEVFHSNYSKLNNTETIGIQSDSYSIYASTTSPRPKLHNETGTKNSIKKEKIAQQKSGILKAKKHKYDSRSAYLGNEPPLKRYLNNLPLRRYVE